MSNNNRRRAAHGSDDDEFEEEGRVTRSPGGRSSVVVTMGGTHRRRPQHYNNGASFSSTPPPPPPHAFPSPSATASGSARLRKQSTTPQRPFSVLSPSWFTNHARHSPPSSHHGKAQLPQALPWMTTPRVGRIIATLLALTYIVLVLRGSTLLEHESYDEEDVSMMMVVAPPGKVGNHRTVVQMTSSTSADRRTERILAYLQRQQQEEEEEDDDEEEEGTGPHPDDDGASLRKFRRRKAKGPQKRKQHSSDPPPPLSRASRHALEWTAEQKSKARESQKQSRSKRLALTRPPARHMISHTDNTNQPYTLALLQEDESSRIFPPWPSFEEEVGNEEEQEEGDGGGGGDDEAQDENGGEVDTDDESEESRRRRRRLAEEGEDNSEEEEEETKQQQDDDEDEEEEVEEEEGEEYEGEEEESEEYEEEEEESEEYEEEEEEEEGEDDEEEEEGAEEGDDDYQWRMSPASMEELCGEEARRAAKAHPEAYLSRDALSTGDSRVLLTGVLGSLGIHLALALAERCQVDVIMGSDNMFPNAVLHRMQMARRISLLARHAKPLQQPIMTAYVGLDLRLKLPHLHPGARTFMIPSTGELNFLTFQPTHIVHLSAADEMAYRDAKGVDDDFPWRADQLPRRHNFESPYSTPNRRVPPLFQIRQSAVSMEHILASVASSWKLDLRPHVLYASSQDIYQYNRHGPQREGQPHQRTREDEEFEELTKANDGKKQRLRAATQRRLTEEERLRRQWDDAREMHGPTKIVDEVLAGSYYTSKGIYSVGLRLGTVYGPWFTEGYLPFDLGQGAARNWNSLEEMKNKKKKKKKEKKRKGSDGSYLLHLTGLDDGHGDDHYDFVFVDDAVNAILAAMQYRHPEGTPAVFDVATKKTRPLSDMAAAMERMMGDGNENRQKRPVGEDEKETEDAAVEILGWSPQTSFWNGVAKLLAWHLDEELPFGPGQLEERAVEETGDDFLEAVDGGSVCLAPEQDEDGTSRECLRGRELYPCASECASSARTCRPSPLDEVASLTRELSEGCEAVLYTHSLGYDVQELVHDATVVDTEDEDLAICTFIFVPTNSTFVRDTIRKAPAEAMTDVGAAEIPAGADPLNVLTENQMRQLNGYLVFKGWTVVWMSDAEDGESLSPFVRNTFKLAPGKLFAPSVKHALFVEENFGATPLTADVKFLCSEMQRLALKERTITRFDDLGKKHQYRLAPEPLRHAIVLVAQFKQNVTSPTPAPTPVPSSSVVATQEENEETPKATLEEESNALEAVEAELPEPPAQPAKGPPVPPLPPPPKKISIYDAAKGMVAEWGGDPTVSDPKPLKRQREFYERYVHWVNRDDLRSIYEPLHRYQLEKYWVRTRWVVHDLQTEEARLFRCAWYAEHSHWANELDQLSFAHVMAESELQRKFRRAEPDDAQRKELPAHAQPNPEIEQFTDHSEWHSMLHVGEKFHVADISNVGETVPAHIAVEDMKRPSTNGAGTTTATTQSKPDDDDDDDDDDKVGADGKPTTRFFVRIMSDKVMYLSRKIWAQRVAKAQRAAARRAAAAAAAAEAAGGEATGGQDTTAARR